MDAPARVPVNAAVVPTSGLVGEWKLDEMNGATVAIDTKGGADATVSGSAAFVTGQLTRALQVNNGSNGNGSKYAVMQSSSTLNTVQETSYSISAWYKPSSMPSLANHYHSIVVKPGQTLGLVYNNVGKFSMRHYLADGTLVIAQASTVYNPGQWHHLVGVVSKINGWVRLYIDGVQAVQADYTGGTGGRVYGTTAFRIGKALSDWAADGLVDQVRIYDRALTLQDAMDLFNESVTTPPTGIPFGLFGLNPDSTFPPNTIWTGGARTNKNLNNVLSELAAAKTKVPRLKMWYIITGGDEGVFRNTDSSFNLNRWRDTLDSVAAPLNPDGTSSYNDTLATYILDGTLQGIIMLDDLNNFIPAITAGQLESMAVRAKLRFPTLLTAVRDRATNLKNRLPVGGTYHSLDVAWAQFKLGVGAAPAYRNAEIAAADTAKLGLVLGINITNGGSVPAGTAVSPDSLRSWGDTLLQPIASDYVCGFIMWNIGYDSLRTPNGVNALANVANVAKNHVAAPCRRRP